jgi:hypothetical protein
MIAAFSPQRDAYILMRRAHPSPMMVGGTIIDRAAYRLAISGQILCDIERWRLERLLTLPGTSEKEKELIGAELAYRQHHSVFEYEDSLRSWPRVMAREAVTL